MSFPPFVRSTLPISIQLIIYLVRWSFTYRIRSALEEVMGLILDPIRVIVKYIKRFTYCCYFRCATFIVWVGVGFFGQKQAQLNTIHGLEFQIRVMQSKGWLCAIVAVAFEPGKRFDPILLLSTVHWGVNRNKKV